MSKNEEIIRITGLTGTVYILEHLSTHKETHYIDLNETLSCQVLTVRLKQLLDLGLIEHHFERKDTRKEWYTITEKGKKALEYIRKLQDIDTLH